MADNKPKQMKQAGKQKVSSSRTKRQQKIQDEQKRLKELEASIRSQVAAEEQAHRIVENLVLEDEISEEFLLNSANLITSGHYADVIEERMIAQKCGYPLCTNQLSQIPSQRYKISMQTNRVYDITERKCFCSNFCFKASKYFGSQLSDSPVWTRIGESLKTFVLLDREGSSCSDEIKDDRPTNYGQNDFNGHLNNTQDQVGGTAINEYKKTDSNQDFSQEKNSEIVVPENSTCDGKDSSPTALSSSSSSSSSPTHEKHDSSAGKRQFASKKEERQDTRKESIVEYVQVVFQEWCTHSTLEYLGFSEKAEAGSRLPEDRGKDPDSFMARAARFFQPVINVKEDSDSDSETGASSKLTKEEIVVKERKSFDKNPVYILPPIDSKSQSTIRRRIVLDKLFRTLPDLLSEIKLTVGEISRDLTQLVHTFSLSNKNVALKPLQWKILCLALIVLLQQKNSLVSQAMETWSNELDALLGRLAITRQDIDHVLSPAITRQDIDHVVSPAVTHQDIDHVMSPAITRQDIDHVVSPAVTHQDIDHVMSPAITRQDIDHVVSPAVTHQDIDHVMSPAITRQDINEVMSPLSSFQPQHLGHYEELKPGKTIESSETEITVVLEERKDYGDMEELD